MNRDIFIRNLNKDKIEMSPKGRNANELTVTEFEKCYENFFDMIFEIAGTDISSETGYGEFDENNRTEFYTRKGERVRSKSELIIAEELQRYQVPYLYEKPLELKETKDSPLNVGVLDSYIRNYFL